MTIGAVLTHTRKLTERELECLELICQGLDHKQMAGVLKISKRTVEVHARHIRDKLGALSIAQATFIAGRDGLLGARE